MSTDSSTIILKLQNLLMVTTEFENIVILKLSTFYCQEAAPISAGPSSESRGEMKLVLVYEQNTLHVRIIEAIGLFTTDPSKTTSPFVECYLLPDKSRKGKRKSQVKRKTVNPKWDESFEFTDISVGDLYSRVLEVTVWDHAKPTHHFLGGLRLGVARGDEMWHDCTGDEVGIWERMVKQIGMLSEAEIPLRATMTSKHVLVSQQQQEQEQEDDEQSLTSSVRFGTTF